MDSFRGDGKAVNVTYTGEAPIAKGLPLYQDGFYGMTMGAASSGERVAIEIAQREHEIVIGSGVAAAKGAILYIHTDNTVDATASGGKPFMKVTVAKDSNNVVWGILLPQA